MVEFQFTEMLWRPLTSFRVVPAVPEGVTSPARRGMGDEPLLIPPAQVERVMSEVGGQSGLMGLKQLAKIKDIVEGWYAAACGIHAIGNEPYCTA